MKAFFTVSGPPVGKGRPRFCKSGFVYTPAKTKQYESYIQQCYLKQCGKTYFGNRSIIVSIKAYSTPLTKFKKAEKQDALKNKLRPSSKPDVDNVLKIVLDALNGLAYDDDRYICELTIKRFYSEEPRVEVTVSDIDVTDKEKNFD